MASKLYAWSDIHSAKDGKSVIVKRGDVVTATALGLDNVQFDQLVSAGAIREQKYPENIGYRSPAGHFKKRLANLARGVTEIDDEAALVEVEDDAS